MLIKASAALRNDYMGISDLAKKTRKPIYITRNGEGDLVVMDIEAFEEYQEVLEMRSRVLDAEEQRIHGEKGFKVAESRRILTGY